MFKLIFNKVIQFVLVLFFTSVISFCIIRFAPGDPLMMYKTEGMSQVQISEEGLAKLEETLGLNGSLHEQYVFWAKNMLSGNWGKSAIDFQPVKPQVMEKLPATIGLIGISLLIAVILAIPLGLIAGYKDGKIIDNIISFISYIGISIPSFWFGIILVIFFSLNLKLLPSSGIRTVGVDSTWDLIKHAIMPAAVLVMGNLAVFIRYIRANTITQLKEDYVLTAISVGSSKIELLFKHILKNCLLPVITVIGMNFGSILSISLVVETVFGWPGLGSLVMSAINTRDYPMVMAITMVSCLLLLIGNISADILYGFADPRIRNHKA